MRLRSFVCLFQSSDATLAAKREELAALRMGRGPSGVAEPTAPPTAQARRDVGLQPPSRSPASAVRRGSRYVYLRRTLGPF
jgi:hypothetical protein